MTLKYIQIEPISRCNQRCFFCPVSTGDRGKEPLPQARLERIIAELKGRTIEMVAISGFTEPSHDPDLVVKIEALRAAGLAVHIFTNGSNLRPALVDRLLALGVARFVVNLSTLDEQEYEQTRGTKDLKRVRPNLDYLTSQRAADGGALAVEIVVIGRLDLQHANNVRAIAAAYGAQATVSIMPMSEFAAEGYAVYPDRPHLDRLQGCLWQRQTEWLHINADGNAILCCRDYDAKYVLGNVDEHGLDALLDAQRMQQWRRWVEGSEEAPADFICRDCLGALRPDHQGFLKAFYCNRCELPRALGPENACPHCRDVGHTIDYLNEYGQGQGVTEA